MVVALQVAGPAPRRWFRRRKASAQMEKIRVGDGMYYLITARPDKRGRLPWEEIRRLAGRGAGRMLLPGGLEGPDEAGIKPFCGELLGQEMMAITAVHLLRVGTAAPRRTMAAIYDPRGRMPQLAPALLPYTADVRVVTSRPELYEEQEEKAMDQYGATFLVTGDTAALHRAPLVLAPEGLGGQRAGTRGYVLSGVQETGRNVVGGYIPRIPSDWLAAKPAFCDPWIFLSAMYEWGGLRGILARPPAALWMNGRYIRIEEAALKLAGLDIGISV